MNNTEEKIPDPYVGKRNEYGWERLEINRFSSFEYIDCSDKEVIALNRDWLLGGEHFEWRWYKELSGNLILERR